LNFPARFGREPQPNGDSVIGYMHVHLEGFAVGLCRHDSFRRMVHCYRMRTGKWIVLSDNVLFRAPQRNALSQFHAVAQNTQGGRCKDNLTIDGDAIGKRSCLIPE
jgi:hypothetical protein